ncbi:MAG TPA: acetyl ornithine aminotransferase family protein [Aggregatilineales bacterium]|nr:acetyl ornithine aminotransferase family protein [Anaerolineales bacterium]HRE46997.1 acetyl ornithine aminotransferase family protein [Aggregatilineales bacterium]
MGFTPGKKSRAILDRDQQVISPSYTRGYPFVMGRGRGAEVWDADGERFLDFTTGIAVTATGHSHPSVVKAIQDQAEKFLHMSGTDFYYETQVELAEKLSAIAPFGGEPAMVFFGNSGTEGIEAALKLARYHTKRPQYITFMGGFHGRTMGSLSLTGSKYVQRKGFFPTMPGVTHIPFADAFRPVLNMEGFTDYGERVIDYLENTVFRTIVPAQEVAAVLVESIQGEGGYVVPTPGFFPALRALCDKHGILLIIDEVQAGIGRTGKWWGIEHFDVHPDIIVSAKGLASGMPLGAMIARKSVMTWTPGAHASTFGGNPVCCAAALATLKLLEEGLIESAAQMGDYLMGKLTAMQARFPFIGQVRGKGLMIGLDFVTQPGMTTPDRDCRDAVVDAAFEERLLLLGAGQSALRIIPPLNISREHADEGLAILERVLTQVAHTYHPHLVREYGA